MRKIPGRVTDIVKINDPVLKELVETHFGKGIRLLPDNPQSYLERERFDVDLDDKHRLGYLEMLILTGYSKYSMFFATINTMSLFKTGKQSEIYILAIENCAKKDVRSMWEDRIRKAAKKTNTELIEGKHENK